MGDAILTYYLSNMSLLHLNWFFYWHKNCFFPLLWSTVCQNSNINYDNMIFIFVERFPHSLDGRCYISGICFLMCYFCDNFCLLHGWLWNGSYWLSGWTMRLGLEQLLTPGATYAQKCCLFRVYYSVLSAQLWTLWMGKVGWNKLQLYSNGPRQQPD